MATDLYEELRNAILTGRYTAGQVLSENALAAEFGKSRTPVREALHRLEIESLVERSPRGVRVRDTSPEEILDIYEVRITLEGTAAKAAAQRATEFDLTQLRSALQAMIDADDTAEAKAATNRRFHEAVWTASHNSTLVDLLHRLNVHLVRYPSTTLTYGERWDAVLREHEELLAAIEARDGEAARRIAEHHMFGAREVRLRMYADGDRRN
nr:GntR family transcriptional regulator [Mycolicibacterium malmesburyense]CRL77275.1 GntR family transcriptional regulator [Mycolicibacterium malmesburyense]